MKKKIDQYENLILDFDGVIADTNQIKKSSIIWAVSKYITGEKRDEFVEYFVGNNGLPREIKIKTFFGSGETVDEVLKRYNTKLEQEYYQASFTWGFEKFLRDHNDKNLYILSGGDQQELVNFVTRRGYYSDFKMILGGPKRKEENIGFFQLEGKSLYIGDSIVDFEVAARFGIDFVFMYGYTQFADWKNYFSKKKIVCVIEDLTVFHKT